ncbi:MAG: PDZ domain-containing protein [Blastocatellia bacterium]
MNVCHSCGVERTEQDRFCRSCGVPAPVSVADMEDTRRFNPAAAHGMPSGFTGQFYAPPVSAYAPASPASPVSNDTSRYKTASLRKRMLKHKAFWVFALALLCMFWAVGFGVGRRSARNRQMVAERQERRVSTQEAPNALGFQAGRVSESGYPPEIKGAYVEHLITDDGPAALATIQAGDVLTQLNGKPVRNNTEMRDALDSISTGQTVQADVYREGELLKLQIKVADRNFPPLQPRLEEREQGFFGVGNSTRRCGVPGVQKCGVEIDGVNDNSPADLGGMREGDVVTEFNGFKVRTPEEFNRRIRLTKPRSKVSVTFYRGNTEQKTEMIIGHR